MKSYLKIFVADSISSITGQIKEALESDEVKEAMQKAAEELQKVVE